MPLFSIDRRRPLSADRLLKPLAEFLVRFDELFEAVEAHVKDGQWSEGAAAVRAAIAALRAPTANQLELRAALEPAEAERCVAAQTRVELLEKEVDDRWLATLREQSAQARARENAEKAMPRVIRAIRRKGQAVVRDAKRRA